MAAETVSDMLIKTLKSWKMSLCFTVNIEAEISVIVKTEFENYKIRYDKMFTF